MTGRICRFANRKLMNVLAPRGSNYNKGIAPVTGGKLQDDPVSPWSDEITNNLARLWQVETAQTSTYVNLRGQDVGQLPYIILVGFLKYNFPNISSKFYLHRSLG